MLQDLGGSRGVHAAGGASLAAARALRSNRSPAIPAKAATELYCGLPLLVSFVCGRMNV